MGKTDGPQPFPLWIFLRDRSRTRASLRIALILLIVGATARLLLHVVVMPPYAGLDEIFHVARLSFLEHEGRHPTSQELSVPNYLCASIEGADGALPAFAILETRWPDVAETLNVGEYGTPVDELGFEPYKRTNYQAQQPYAYYSVAAPLVRILGVRTQLKELVVWRLFSVFFALITVGATAWLGYRHFGFAAIVAASLVVSLPTWITLVARTSNDALACALVALALAMTAAGRTKWGFWIGEAVLWSLAMIVKLYSWPVLCVIPIFWWYQRPRKARVTVVSAGCGVAFLLTIWDHLARTENLLGLQAFDPVASSAGGSLAQIDFVEAVKITIASGIWTSGQHWNALTPLGMALFVMPLALAAAVVLTPIVREPDCRPFFLACGGAVVAFGVAQVVYAAGYARSALVTGASLPAAGKEGWYWYVLTPLVVGLIGGLAVKRQRQTSVWLFVAACVWLVSWDVLIHEGALYRDFAGMTSSAYPSALFRWGSIPGVEGLWDRLVRVGVGPFASLAFPLRLVHLTSTAILIGMFVRVSGAEE